MTTPPGRCSASFASKETPKPGAGVSLRVLTLVGPGWDAHPPTELRPRVDDMAPKRNVADKSPSLDARITLRGSEITHDATVALMVHRLRIVQSARRPLSLQRSPSGP